MRALCLSLLLLLPLPAAAQTLLHLSETGHVSVQPDQLVAVLRADAAEPTAAAAQAKVNTAVAHALAAAHATQGVAVSTGFYNVWLRQQPTRAWTASQTIELSAHDGPALLDLVGRLQQDQLAVERLGWQVSPEAARKAQADATKQALAALKGRAEEAAGVLGLHFRAFQEVTIGARPQPVVFPRAMAMSAAAAAPPQAEAQPADISATVEATAVLGGN
jgi:uncharacterized protein